MDHSLTRQNECSITVDMTGESMCIYSVHTPYNQYTRKLQYTLALLYVVHVFTVLNNRITADVKNSRHIVEHTSIQAHNIFSVLLTPYLMHQ